jgi:hypothetical protein
MHGAQACTMPRGRPSASRSHSAPHGSRNKEATGPPRLLGEGWTKEGVGGRHMGSCLIQLFSEIFIRI